ncbi:hypothetical protein MLD38_006291 [Melastoma candidum]|uniref:Uncharacterized protein n=1 Tax=Melastoma candidum TaxID=119954 RepID=A0ACB9RVV7_9MYRT|nr:hypothetical protein MLD38_006291 [Melastoma candidum]
MSGGSPVGGGGGSAGGFVRQRHNLGGGAGSGGGGGYSSNGEDLEDDASSRAYSAFAAPPAVPSGWSLIDLAVNTLWIASAVFVVYYGDSQSNLVFLLLRDGRIRRVPLCLGMISVALNFLIFFYTIMMAWRLRRFDEKWELTSISALPFVTSFGVIGFFSLSFALWPIWGFLSLPLLFTLFMVSMVILPSIMIGILKRKNDGLRVD